MEMSLEETKSSILALSNTLRYKAPIWNGERLYVSDMQHNRSFMIPEFNRLDRNIEKALTAFDGHARRKANYVSDLQGQGLSQEEAEASWANGLDLLRAGLDTAYSQLKNHIYPRAGQPWILGPRIVSSSPRGAAGGFMNSGSLTR